jgi:hypothetical protein
MIRSILALKLRSLGSNLERGPLPALLTQKALFTRVDASVFDRSSRRAVRTSWHEKLLNKVNRFSLAIIITSLGLPKLAQVTSEFPEVTSEKIGNFQKFHTEGNVAISYLKNILLIYL